MDSTATLSLGLALLLVLWLGIARLRRTNRKPAQNAPTPRTGLPPGLSLRPQPLLTPSEAALYNLLQLAAQDRFFVFPQVPIWGLVDIRAQDRHVRASFLNQVALKRVDFALVHPGSLAVAKVIELRDSTPVSPQRQARDRLLDAVCAAAGIELIRLDASAMETVPALAARLGLDPEE